MKRSDKISRDLRDYRERMGSSPVLKTMSWPVPEQRNLIVIYLEIK